MKIENAAHEFVEFNHFGQIVNSGLDGGEKKEINASSNNKVLNSISTNDKKIIGI